jgi:hypothetical protein
MGRAEVGLPRRPHTASDAQLGLAAYTHDGSKNRVTEQHVLAIKADSQ